MKSFFLGSIVVHLTLVLGALATTIYGLVLAFKASVVLGIIALIVEPSPLILGICGLVGHADLAQRLATALGL